jgi:hypothetical protein
MPQAGPARIWRLTAAGVAAGILAAAGLLLGEVGAGALARAPLPPRAWLLLALYYVPALSLAGAVLAFAWPRGIPAPGRVQGLLVAGTAFASAVMVASQDLLRGRGVALRLAGAAAAAVCIVAGTLAVKRLLDGAFAGRPGSARLLLVVLPVVFLGALTQSSAALRDAPASLALLVLPVLATLCALAAASALAWSARRLSRRALTGLAVAIAVPAAAMAARQDRGVIEQAQPPWRPVLGAPARPDIVFIVLDTVRAANMSAYGYERLTTPRLDAFARGAIRYTHAMTVSPWSVPARDTQPAGATLAPSRARPGSPPALGGGRPRAGLVPQRLPPGGGDRRRRDRLAGEAAPGGTTLLPVPQLHGRPYALRRASRVP